MPPLSVVPNQQRIVAPKLAGAYARNAAAFAARSPQVHGPARPGFVLHEAEEPAEIKGRTVMETMQRMMNLMHQNGQVEQPEYKELFALYRELRDALVQSRGK